MLSIKKVFLYKKKITSIYEFYSHSEFKILYIFSLHFNSAGVCNTPPTNKVIMKKSLHIKCFTILFTLFQKKIYKNFFSISISLSFSRLFIDSMILNIKQKSYCIFLNSENSTNRGQNIFFTRKCYDRIFSWAK